MKNTYARQGDLVFYKVSEVVKGTSQKKLVVERGEVTGHAHILFCEAKSSVRGDKTKFTLTGKAKLVHDEHDTINFTKGTYVVLRKTEFDPIEEEIRQVSD